MTQPDDLAFTNLLRVDGTDPYDGFKPVGLTKREYFAAMAMQGFIAGFKVGMEGASMAIIQNEIGALPASSVAVADALIAELNKKAQT